MQYKNGEKQHISIRVFGRVQGVVFRHSAREKARELGVAGFVRNEADGSVYIEAEGEKEKLDAFLEWCREGPPLAEIEKVEFKEREEVKGFCGFEIK